MTIEITQQQLKRLEQTYLPKWPQMLVWGVPVTEEQAKDIILRTDSFMTDTYGYPGGRDRNWITWAQTELGFHHLAVDESPGVWIRKSEIARLLREAIGFVDTEYVTNSWASCAFIYGPHGWCHPNGTIWFEDNVGKDPCARAVFEEWQALAQAFPYLDLTMTLFDGESCEEDSKPVVSFRVQNGAVALLDEPIVPAERLIPERNVTEVFQRRLLSPDGRHGLSNQWISDYGQIIRPLVTRIEAEVAKVDYSHQPGFDR